MAFAGLGCSGSGSPSRAERDPLAEAVDPTLDTYRRIDGIKASAARAAAGEIDRKLWREAIKSKVLWLAGTPAVVRLPAIDALLADDEADTRRVLALLIPRDPQRQVVDKVAALAAERGWTDLAPSLVRRWSMPMAQVPDAERSEAAALRALLPGQPVEKTVFDVFATPARGSDLAERARADAWTVLCRIDKGLAKTREYLAAVDPAAAADDPKLSALRAGAEDLRAVPSSGDQLEWLEALRKPERAAFWNEAKAAIASLKAEQQVGLELRHAAGVRWAAANRPAWLAKGRADLLGEIASRLEGRKTTQRSAELVEGARPRRETVKEAERDLVWGDALLILIADEALRDASVVADLFRQADDDRRDRSTEYGGVLDAKGARFEALSYPPRAAQRLGDNRFVASLELLERGYVALFHYHFHARVENESAYAGPGEGDAEYAQRFGRSCLVVTSISRDSMDVDYFQPNGAVVDLGEIRRP